MVFKDYKTRVPGQGAEAQGEEEEPYPPQKIVKLGRWLEGPEGFALPPLQGEVVRVSEPEGLFLRLNTPQPPCRGAFLSL
ncbi:hypothetical protein FF3_00305 [Fretibacterium fastidiosum]